MSSALATVPQEAPSRSFLGHPRGLAYLAFTEAWERFSYYGMTALLVLYMVNQLLQPGHIEHVIGFAAFRGIIESTTGPLSGQALASEIFGLYAGFVYFTPVLGGWIGDRTGQRNAIVLGAVAMACGHLAMAFDQSFLLALLLLITGSGLLKGNISAQVGTIYPPDDEARRTRGFAIFSTAINLGAVTGPLMCGFLGTRFGWHVGFGAAALFMLGALATYLSGYRYLPARVERENRAPSEPLTAADRRTVAALIAVMAIVALTYVAYYQLANVHPVWLQQHADLGVGGFQIPIPWFYSIDPLVSMLSVPFLFALWNHQARVRGREPSALTKIAIGGFLTTAANLVLVVAIALSRARVAWIWPVLYCAVQGVAFMYFWPTLLALVSKAAPPKINATMMGVAFLTLFVANNLIGRIGAYYEKMTPIAFWALHAAIGAAGGFLALVFAGRLRAILEPRPSAGSEVREV